jgi:transcriptional regulator with XRE-family HTH domain
VTSTPPVPRRTLGRRLRAMREAARLTLDQAAAKLDVSRSALGRVEKGETRVSVHLVRTMMDVYDQYEDGLLDLVRHARTPGWWQEYWLANEEYVAWESCASLALRLSVSRIPDLLQTGPYTEQLLLVQTENIREESRVRRHVRDECQALKVRQTRFAEQPVLHLHAVVTEAALRDVVGSRQVMVSQWAQLVAASRWAAVRLRLLPSSAKAQPRHTSGFTVLEFADPDDRPQLYADCPGELRRDDKQFRVALARDMFHGLIAASLSAADSVAFLEGLIQEATVPA